MYSPLIISKVEQTKIQQRCHVSFTVNCVTYLQLKMDGRKRSGSYTLHDFFSSSAKSKKKNPEDWEDDQGKNHFLK